MTKTQTQPKFVNLQPTAVQVFDETRHPISILPWENRHRDPNGRYVVEGLHFQQFVSGRGPLYPFPDDPNNPPGPLGETEDALHTRLVAEGNLRREAAGAQAATSRGKIRIAAEVLRDGAVVGETQAAFAARLRPHLVRAGLSTEDDFRKAPKHTLLQIEGVTEANLPRVRELAPFIYAEQEPQPEEKVELDELGGDRSKQDAQDEPPPTRYSRKAIEKMNRPHLVRVIEREFEMSTEGTVQDLRKRLIDALLEYELLDD